jgi:hypothetical protein
MQASILLKWSPSSGSITDFFKNNPTIPHIEGGGELRDVALRIDEVS